ncbi:hypothetical protein [Sporosarcina sp. P13]|uniref:hypothetical protein n=1 Tax=Sporosarcina sp. P13 TaxID=2048263 RepID=UPI001304379D|nr:hypothetical protein [Sporosarcina sp. P13]
MHKFLIGFSIVFFIACLVLLIKTFVGSFDWINIVVAGGGMIIAISTIWSLNVMLKINK